VSRAHRQCMYSYPYTWPGDHTCQIGLDARQIGTPARARDADGGMHGVPAPPHGPPPPLPLPPLLGRGRAPPRTLGSHAGPLAPHLAARSPLPSPLGGSSLSHHGAAARTRATALTPAPPGLRPLPMPSPFRSASQARGPPLVSEEILLDMMVDSHTSPPDSEGPTSPTAIAKADAARQHSCGGCLRRATLVVGGLLVLVLVGAGALWGYAGGAALPPVATNATAEAVIMPTPVLDAHARFLLYTPTGPVGEQLQAFVTGCVLAQATGRTLVLPLVADDSGGNVTDAARFAWAPLERYVQAAPLRLLPCTIASLAQLRQWMAQHPAAAARLQYVLSPTLGSGGAAAAAAGQLLKTYYEGVLLLPYAPPARIGASARSIPLWAAALRDLSPLPPSATTTSADGTSPSVLAVGPVHALMTSVSAAEAAAVMRHLVLAKRVRELARKVRELVMDGQPYVAVDAGSDPATVRTCQALARPDERAVCRMPPLLVDAALHDVRMALTTAADTAENAPATVRATINMYVVAHVPTVDALAAWAPVRYRQTPYAEVVLAPTDVRNAMATVPLLKAAGALHVYDNELGAVERALLDVDMLAEASWFIGSVYRPLSVAVAARRTHQTYMLDAASPYAALADSGERR
jgi:hypothetical protein